MIENQAVPEYSAAPEIVERNETYLAVVRERVALGSLPELFDRAYPAIFAALADAGVEPASAPMAITHGEPDEVIDLSVAVPVARPYTGGPGRQGVSPETLPAGRAAAMLVRGDYARLPAAFSYLLAWVRDRGLAPGKLAFEQYLTMPEPGGDPAQNETLVAVMIGD